MILRAGMALVAVLACGPDPRSTGAGVVDSTGLALRDPGVWPTMTFVPRGEEIESVPVARIDSTWSLATVLDRSMLPTTDSATPFALADSTGFRFDGDFNEDGNPDLGLVGVYRDTAGDEGSFLLILTRAVEGGWTPAFVATEPGEPRFSVLVKEGTGLIWAECLACGRWRPLFYSDGRYVLGPPSEQAVIQ